MDGEPVRVGVPASAPVRVGHRLRAMPDGFVRVVHRSRLATYVDLGPGRSPRCVGVLAAAAVAVPNGLRTTLDDLDGLGADAHVADGVLHLGDAVLRVGRLVDVRVPLTGHLGPAQPPALIDPASLIGRGEGLTPRGDDVVCGWLAAVRAIGVSTPEVDAEVRAHLDRTTLLSATLLECALLGECLPEVARWLRARGTPGEPPARAALLAVGGSSGAGLLTGARLALAGRAAAA